MNEEFSVDPVPRQRKVASTPYPYPYQGAIDLAPPQRIPTVSIDAVLENRQSERHFGALNLETLSAFLWLGGRTRMSLCDKAGLLWQSRAAPSAGGCHPIDLLLTWPGVPECLFLYNPIYHRLEQVSADQGTFLRKTAAEILDPLEGTVLWLVAQVWKTNCKYENPVSLIWRDSGALLATLGFAAEALRLAFCQLGILGDQWVRNVFKTDQLLGVGGCIVGSRLP